MAATRGSDSLISCSAKRSSMSSLQNQYSPNYITHSGNLYVSDNWKVSQRLTVTAGLAWDALPSFIRGEGSRRILLPEALGSRQRPSNWITTDESFPEWRSVQWHGSGGKEWHSPWPCRQSLALFQPRLGVAWRPVGDDTVLRAGYGLYYERIQGNDIYNVAPNPPFVSTATIFNTDLSNPGGGGAAIPVSNLTVYDPSYPVPQVQQWNAGIQHKIIERSCSQRCLCRHQGHLSFRYTEYQSTVPELRLPCFRASSYRMSTRRARIPATETSTCTSMGLELELQLSAGEPSDRTVSRADSASLLHVVPFA